MSIGLGSFSMQGRFSLRAMLANNNAAEIAREYFFGTEIYELSAFIVGTSAISAVLSSTAWSFGADGWTLNSGSSDRYVVVTIPPDFGAFAISLHLTDPDHHVFAWVRGAEDGRDCYEGGVFDVTGTLTAQIRTCTDGTVDAAAVTNGASDTPASAACESDVSALVSSGDSFTIEVRIAAGFIEFRLNGETAARLRHTPTLWDGQIAIGFGSDVDGARVLDAKVSSLTGNTESAREVLVAVCDGDVWASVGTGIARVATGVFPATGRVQMEPFGSVMLMLGPLVNGIAAARIYDPVRGSVGLWEPTSGTLPGQTIAGTTTAQVLSTHGTRAVLARWFGDEQNAGLSTVDDGTTSGGYLNWDYASELNGHAWVLGSERPLKLGQPIAAWKQFDKTVSIIACDNSVHALIGDLAIGLMDTQTISDSEGVNGDQAVLLVDEGKVLGHGPSGLVGISPAGGYGSLSQGVLVADMQLSRNEIDRTTIVLAVDPQRSYLWIFRTPTDGSQGFHVVYDELVGKYKKDAPGFFQQTFPATIQPTCATLWRKVMVVGCLDGYLRELDDRFRSDEVDEDVAIPAKVVGELISGASIRQESQLSNPVLEMSPDSDPVNLKVYGARTPAEVYRSDRRTVLLNKTVDAHQHEPIALEVRAVALLVEISNDTPGETFVIEMLEADIEVADERTSV